MAVEILKGRKANRFNLTHVERCNLGKWVGEGVITSYTLVKYIEYRNYIVVKNNCLSHIKTIFCIDLGTIAVYTRILFMALTSGGSFSEEKLNQRLTSFP